MRLFIAIEIPEKVKDYLCQIQVKFANNNLNKIKLVNLNNIHLTLKFLGEVQPKDIEIIKEYLKKIMLKKFNQR